MRVLVVMPTYEEADSLPGVLQRLRTSEPDVDVLVVDMVRAAGLGVGFRAKKVLADAADANICHGDLTALLYLQGYRLTEFKKPA